MKHLLNGVAIAAALAIAVPAWAQAPMTPGAPKPAAAAPAPIAAAPAAAAPKAAKQRHRPMRHVAKGGKMRMKAGGSGDQMTEQLNREELARIQGGGMPQPMGGMPPGPANAGAGQGGPRASGR
jgi:hypothetical protein